MPYEHDVFLSHNNADKVWTENLASRIEADKEGRPLKVFFDKWDINPGSDIPSELENGLRSSRYVALVLSPESVASDWVALKRSSVIYQNPAARAKSLLPILRRDCDVPLLVARISYIDFRRDADFEESLNTLIRISAGYPDSKGWGEQSGNRPLLEKCSEPTFRLIEISSEIALKRGFFPEGIKAKTHEEPQPLDEPLLSHLSNVLREVEDGLRRAEHPRTLYNRAESEVMSSIRQDQTRGIYGEEARYFDVRQFPSGSMVGVIFVWPGHEEQVYAVVFDEKFPEYFSILTKKYSSHREAGEDWENLEVPGSGETQATFLKNQGWEQLI